jgi:Protein of unknown function (DUF1800)
LIKVSRLLAPVICSAFALAGGILDAQRLALAPTGYIAVGPGGKQQYTIMGDFYKGATFVWFASGNLGGNSTVGTISPTGLYTAPQTPPSSGQVRITAVLYSNPTISASAYISVLPVGPTITSVSPNPIPLGTDLITLTGSGFQPGGVIFVGGVQYGIGFVNSTTIEAIIYQGKAQSTTVTARNPGSVSGNTLVVPVGGSGSAPAIAPVQATVVLGATQQFTAAGATSWSAVSGTVTSAGLYTAPKTMPAGGTDTVTAKNSSGQSTATVTLVNAAPVIAPTQVSVVLGGTEQFTAAGATSWSAVSGTVTSTGLYTAPKAMPAGGSDTVTAKNSSGQSTATVALVNAAPVIAPTQVSVVLGGTEQFTAAGATSWSAVSGTVTSAGLYTAPSAMPAGGTDTVTAKNSSGQSTAAVTLANAAPAIAPTQVTVVLGATQQFTAAGATSWSAVSGTVTSAGLYTAPSAMPAGGTDTVTAKNSSGQSTATVTLANVGPTISSIGTSPLPLGVFSTTVTGTGFTAQSVAQLNGVNLTTVFNSASSLTVSGFAGTAGSANLTVANNTVVSQPFAVGIGVQNPQVSASAARRFLEQAAFGPTPADAAHLQTIGFQPWLAEQFAMPVISNYNAVTGSQEGMPSTFLANAVTNADQLRQRVAFALSQIFVTSITTVIWNGDMIPFEQMLIGDAFTTFRKILGDVTLNPAMGEYLDMANNAKANPAAGTVANENYAREVMQLFSMGDVLLNQDGSVQTNTNGPIPAYSQTNVTELARVLTGWTYAPPAGQSVNWGAYITENGPMVNYDPEHDFGSKTLLNGYVAPANLGTVQDLNAALDNIASHPNVAPFISKQLIQHLVKSNPSPAYVSRVAQTFTASFGDMPTVISAILLDSEARANDAGGNDQPTDGHLQEPALFVPGFVRAFGGTMTTGNYYANYLAAMGQDIYNPASVFSYFSPFYSVPGTGGLIGPEFEIDNPNNVLLRENLIGGFFSQYSNPVQNFGPGTLVDLTPFLPLASTPSTLVNALDLTLTHGTMPAAMKQTIVTAVTTLAPVGSLYQVQTACYLILTSSYYNVWH